jgi:malate dehydrogenase (oxaloacetate-decarboxylating)
MKKYTVDTVFRVRLRHRPGQLAAVTAAVAEEGGLIGEITTLRITEDVSVRDITIESEDEQHTERLVHAIGRVEGVEVQQTTDRVFEAHRGGKIHAGSRVDLKQPDDLRRIYTPGVARVARAIHADPEKAWDYTTLGNSVGIFTNGSRVLGLGDIGPLASLPVMEGKAVLYDRLVGLSAVPILISTHDAREFVETVLRISRSFGAVHLEDIRAPECFVIEAELKAKLDKPVMHDDQHGTAAAALAAVINACKLTGIELANARLGQIGLGAAGGAIAKLALAYGVREVLVTDVSAEAMDRLAASGARACDFDTVMREADIVIATTGRAGLIRPEKVKKGQVIFALSNPDPEIDPETARAAGAAFAIDGRSVNNALVFPGLFKAALDVRSRAITVEMIIASAEAVAACAEPGEVVPSPLDRGVHDAVRRAVAEQARRLGLEGTARL